MEWSIYGTTHPEQRSIQGSEVDTRQKLNPGLPLVRGEDVFPDLSCVCRGYVGSAVRSICYLSYA